MTRAVEIDDACLGEAGVVGALYFEPKESCAVNHGRGTPASPAPALSPCSSPRAATGIGLATVQRSRRSSTSRE